MAKPTREVRLRFGIDAEHEGRICRGLGAPIVPDETELGDPGQRAPRAKAASVKAVTLVMPFASIHRSEGSNSKTYSKARRSSRASDFRSVLPLEGLGPCRFAGETIGDRS